MRVEFFIIGAQKGGTTALNSFLRCHPSLQMARVKEVHYFDNEAINWSDPDLSALHGQFEPGGAAIRGEATPIYLYWPNALERLKRYNENAKLIVCLRHPSFRAFSHWRMEYKRGDETIPFAEAILDKARERVAKAPGGAHRVFSYVERGFYAEQIARLLTLFARSQILFLRTEALWVDPNLTLTKIYRFLGVDPKPRDGGSNYIVPINTRDLGVMPEMCRDSLDRLYRKDIEHTAQLTGLDLSDWLSPDYTEPMIAPA